MNFANPTIVGNHEASRRDPLLMVPSHQNNNNNMMITTRRNDFNMIPSMMNPTTPRFDSPYSLHEDVANFLNCIKLALQNPYTPIDEQLLRNCIGFTRQFPLVDGITEDVWGGSVVNSMKRTNMNNGFASSSSSSLSSATPVTESQQKMLLWMQELQFRIEAATKRNLDIAASAFGPCEEARRDRGVSGRSDVEAVRSDLEWWLKQHEELEQRLKMQKEFLRKINADMDYTSAGGNSITSANTFQRANDLQDMQIARALAASSLDPKNSNNFSSSENHGRNLWTNLQRTMTLVDDVAALSRSVSQQQQDLHQTALGGNNNNMSNSNANSRSTSVTKRSASVKDVADTLNYELLALQAATYRTESVAETREKLVQCVLSLGSLDYENQKFVRTATNPQNFR